MSDSRIPPPSEPEPDPDLGRWLADVIQTVRAPAAALQWYGIVSMVLAALLVTAFLAAPDQIAESYRKREVEKQKGLEPADRKPVPSVDEISRAMQVRWLGIGAVWLVCGFLTAYGGVRMRQLHGYGWAVIGSFLSAIPCTSSCCCVGTPIGLWALVILFGSDVRLGFARVGSVGGLGTYEEEQRSRDEEGPRPPIRLE